MLTFKGENIRALTSLGPKILKIFPGSLSLAIFLMSVFHLKRMPPSFYFDPEFAYLYNGGVISQGGTPGHTDHPGTSLQWICGLISRFLHVFRSKELSFSQDLVSNPEVFLLSIRIFLAFLFCLCLYFFCIKVFKLLGIHLGLMTIAFVCMGIGVWYPYIILLTPESLVASVCLIVMALLLPSILDRTDQPTTKTACLIGIALAIGITGKVILLPLFILIPFTFRVKEFLIVSVSTAVTAMVILIPVYSKFGVMLHWFTSVASSPDRYGIDPATKWSVRQNLLRAANQLDAAFPFAWIMILVVLAEGIFVVRNIKINHGCTSTGFNLWPTFGLTLTVLATFLIGYKSFTIRDFVLIPFLTPILMSIFFMKGQLIRKMSIATVRSNSTRYLSAAAIICCVLLPLRPIVSVNRTVNSSIRNQNTTIQNSKDALKDAVIVNVYPSIALEYASNFGNSWAANNFSKELQNRYPNYLELNIWNKTMYGYKSNKLVQIECKDLASLLLKSRVYLVIDNHILESYWPERTQDIILQSSFALQVTKIEIGISDKVFEITSCT